MKKLLLSLSVILLTACSLVETSTGVELIPFIQKENYGYFNLEGKIAINPQFGFATAFRENIALVRTSGKEGKWGYIGQDGKYIINATYTDATVFQEGIAWVVTENSEPMAIDKEGKTKFTLKGAEHVELYSEGLAAFAKLDSTTAIWGFIDKAGKQVVNPQFQEVRQFSDGKCAVKNKEGKWGYINKEGKIVINYQFDNANNFVVNEAVVYLDNKAGIIDKDGRYIVNPQFQYADIDGNSYSIWQDDKGGWCDKDGKFLINPQFDSMNNFGSSHLAAVESSGKFGYVDKEGKIAINPQFDEAWPFMDNLALVKSGGKFGLINEEGKYIVNPQFDAIGRDLLIYITSHSKGSVKSIISSQFVDINSILSVIKLNHPEGTGFNEDFKAIALRFGKTVSDFSTSETNVLFSDKFINQDATYAFGVIGAAVTYDYYYGKNFTAEKPTGFIYGITLLGKAKGKAEQLEKAFEAKLKSHKLLKKGFIDNNYTSIYQSDRGYVICANNGADVALFYILPKEFDAKYYIEKISDERASKDGAPASDNEQPPSEETYTEEVEEVDSTTIDY